MNKEIPFGGHEKPPYFCASAVPGESVQPPVTHAEPIPVDTGKYIEQQFAAALPKPPVMQPFDQEEDDPRWRRRW